MISSRDFLQEAGVSLAGPPDAPADLRNLLITAALTCVAGPVVAKVLTNNGREISSRTVANWLQTTRVWLGLPPANRGKRSRKYRRELEEWHRANGHPTADEIDAGWIPSHQRSPKQPNSPPTDTRNLPDVISVAKVPAQPAMTAPRSAKSMYADGDKNPDKAPQPAKTDWAEEARKTEEFARQPHPTPQPEKLDLPIFKKPRAPGNVLTATQGESESYAVALQVDVAIYKAAMRKRGYEIADSWTGHGDPLRHASKIDQADDSHKTTSEWGISTT